MRPSSLIAFLNVYKRLKMDKKKLYWCYDNTKCKTTKC